MFQGAYHCNGLNAITNALFPSLALGISSAFKCLVQHIILRCGDA